MCRHAPRTPPRSCFRGRRTGRRASGRTTAGSTLLLSGQKNRCSMSTSLSMRRSAPCACSPTWTLRWPVPHPRGGRVQNVVPGSRLPVRVPRRRLLPARYVVGPDEHHAQGTAAVPCHSIRLGGTVAGVASDGHALGPPGSCALMLGWFVQV